jgi:hypothetical protein
MAKDPPLFLTVLNPRKEACKFAWKGASRNLSVLNSAIILVC